MVRWGLWVAIVVTGCAGAAEADNLPPPSLGMSTADGASSGGSSDGDSSSGSGGPSAADSSTGVGGEGGSTAAETNAMNSDTSGGPAPICPPDASDDACFTCGRQACCVQVTACMADPVCNCALACIQPGGDAQVCLDDCGGQNEASIELLGCIYFQCPVCNEP